MDEQRTSTPAEKSRLLLALDFDGTVATIVDRPADAMIDRRMLELLETASSIPSVSAAIVSGRDLEDLHQRTATLDVFRIGSHGADCAFPDNRLMWGTESHPLSLGESLTDDIMRSRFRIERKKLSIAVHFRNVEMAAARLEVLNRFRDWARSHGLDLVAGRSVLEARVRAAGKLSALRQLARHLRPSRVIYAGDDLTDFESLSWAARRGRGLFVMSEEREPPDDPAVERVRDIAALHQILLAELDAVRAIDCVAAAV